MFDQYFKKWGLVADGEKISTHCSHLLPVIFAGKKAMLKISFEEEECFGGTSLSWWDGDGAVKVYKNEGDALLMERAVGHRSLAAMARSGCDEEATRIICHSIERLHQPRQEPLPKIIPLKKWFSALFEGADKYGGAFIKSSEMAGKLLAQPKNETVLHGDVHHDNVLDSKRGWLVIDPKGLYGERTFDYANLFCNPDKNTACNPEIFNRRAALVAELAGIEYNYLMQWIVAWAGLSNIWCLNDNITPHIDFSIAEMALAKLS